jgi:hypothetical protein
MFADDTLLRFTHHLNRDHSRKARIVRWRPHEPVTRSQTLHGEDLQTPTHTRTLVTLPDSSIRHRKICSLTRTNTHTVTSVMGR